MKKQFRPVIKHDVVTQTYTIRDKNGVVIQVPDVIIDRLDTYYNTLEAQRIALSHSYKQVLEENEELERENERLKEVKQEIEELREAFQYQLEKRLEYFTKCQELKEENKELKDKLKD